MKIRLQIGISTVFTVIVVAIVAVSAAIMYKSNRDLALETAEASMAAARETTVAKLLNIVTPVGRLVERTADRAGRFPVSTVSDSGVAFLGTQVQQLPQIYSLYFGTAANGDFHQIVQLPDVMRTFGSDDVLIPDGASMAHRRIIDRQGLRGEAINFFRTWGISVGQASGASRYDPRQRPWYKGAMGIDGLAVSDVYTFQSTGELGITFSKRVDDPLGRAIGVVGADLTMTQVVEVLRDIRIGEHGRVFLLDSGGSLIAYVGPDETSTSSRTPGDMEKSRAVSSDDVIATAIRSRHGDASGYFQFEMNGRNFLASAATVPDEFGLNHTLGFIVPDEHFIGAIKQNTVFVLQVSAIIMVLAIGLIFWVSRLVSGQLTMATDEANNIGQMNLNSGFELRSVIHEVDSLGSALSNMRTALQTFLKYAPKDLVTEIVKSGKPAQIGGSRQEVTLMFTDIAGFTTMSEKMTPEDVMSYMSVYFELLTQAIADNNGTVDKFIGDAIMAMWNAPIANPNHVRDACDAALLACRASNQLNDELAANNFPQLRTRFGLHCCEALVGNVGAPDRMQFTSLGAGVNLASRIEGLNKFYRTQILVSDTVRKKAGPKFLFRRIDLVTAKGTTRPVTVFELLGERDEKGEFYVGPVIIKQAVKYEQAFDFYLHRDFEDARDLLRDLHAEAPDDFVIETVLARCEGYIETPPPPEWNGSTALEEK